MSTWLFGNSSGSFDVIRRFAESDERQLTTADRHQRNKGTGRPESAGETTDASQANQARARKGLLCSHVNSGVYVLCMVSLYSCTSLHGRDDGLPAFNPIGFAQQMLKVESTPVIEPYQYCVGWRRRSGWRWER